MDPDAMAPHRTRSTSLCSQAPGVVRGTWEAQMRCSINSLRKAVSSEKAPVDVEAPVLVAPRRRRDAWHMHMWTWCVQCGTCCQHVCRCVRLRTI